MIRYFQRFGFNLDSGKLWELSLSLVVGLLFGFLVVFSPYLPISSDFQKLILVIPFAFTLVILFNNLERLILFTIAIAVPLNLDISLIISPYARNAENLATGRTIVALTELRLSLVLIIVAVGYLLWLVERQGNNRRPVRFFASTSIPSLGLILVSILSVTRAQDRQLSFFKIMQLVELFLIYFYLANHIRTRQDMKFFVTVLLGGMLTESILMIIQWRTGWGFSVAGITTVLMGNRPAGTLGPVDVAGEIIAAQLAIVCAMIWLYPKRSHKAFAVICFIMGCIALITSAVRAAWGSLIVVITVFMLIAWWRNWITRRSLVLLVLLILVIGGIFYPVISNRLTEYDYGSAASRPKMFRLAWNIISASPSNFFFGVGANNYALIAPAYNTTDVGYLGNVIDSSVHNAYLLTWTETGLIGLTFFFSFLLAPFVIAWKHIRSKDRFSSLNALGLGCALFAVAIQMLAAPFIQRSINIFLWVVVSLVVSLDNLGLTQVRTLVTRQDYEHEYPKPNI